MKKKFKNNSKKKPKGPPWYWGDKRADWNGINLAADFIGLWLRETARISVMQWKEKFGCVRVYCSFGFYSFYEIVRPGYSWIPNWWPYSLDLFLSQQVGLINLVNKIAVPIQKKLYRRRYQAAVDKWPHLKLEILTDADHQELLDGIHGYKSADYWRSL